MAQSEKQKAAQVRYHASPKGKARDARYRRTLVGKAAKIRANARQRRLHPERIAAGHAIYNAIRSGTLTRLPCFLCGTPKTEAHHHLGYAEEHWLDVQWLCKKHHREVHKKGLTFRTVYISGAMRGLPEYNAPAFVAAAVFFRARGWGVVNPAELDAEIGPNGKKIFDFNTTVRRDSAAILGLSRANNDAIAAISGWESSIGATAEVFLARFKGLLILDARDGLPLTWFDSSCLNESLGCYLARQQVRESGKIDGVLDN